MRLDFRPQPARPGAGFGIQIGRQAILGEFNCGLLMRQQPRQMLGPAAVKLGQAPSRLMQCLTALRRSLSRDQISDALSGG